MEIGSKIKQLRNKMGLTQEQLAERLTISPQSVSKWENGLTMPDVMLLPALSEVLGVSIDELFDLTVEHKLNRIDNRMDMDADLPRDVFYEYEEFLLDQLKHYADRRRILSLLAHLYAHRMDSDARQVSRYAHEAILLDPARKDCQWLLVKSDRSACWDWNVDNHSKVIDFFKEAIRADKITPRTTMSYFYVIDNLLADNRLDEAEQYLNEFAQLPAAKPQMVEVYRAYIALGRHDVKGADSIMEEALAKYPEDGIYLFEAAQYYARKCEYDKAISLYERSYEHDSKPRYIDALQGIAIIQEIRGQYAEAAATYDRIIENQQVEWGMTEEVEIEESRAEKARLLARAQ
ncbi:MAG: DUF3808 domain-containing protein [Clostridia bacterium]|nr:DUF3808 domain-containing protein [Clostridia bacterium]